MVRGVEIFCFFNSAARLKLCNKLVAHKVIMYSVLRKILFAPLSVSLSNPRDQWEAKMPGGTQSLPGSMVGGPHSPKVSCLSHFCIPVLTC